jgi:hypothetical protein
VGKTASNPILLGEYGGPAGYCKEAVVGGNKEGEFDATISTSLKKRDNEAIKQCLAPCVFYEHVRIPFEHSRNPLSFRWHVISLVYA